MPAFSIQGSDKTTGESRWEKVEAATELLARSKAENQLNMLVTSVTRMPYPKSLNAANPKAYGLTRKEAWIIAVIGILFTPGLIGIPLLIWGILAERRIREQV